MARDNGPGREELGPGLTRCRQPARAASQIPGKPAQLQGQGDIDQGAAGRVNYRQQKTRPLAGFKGQQLQRLVGLRHYQVGACCRVIVGQLRHDPVILFQLAAV